MTKIKKFLNENQPNNILNYLDMKKGIDTSFIDWYESDYRNSKNPIFVIVYKVIVSKPKIQWWVTKKLSDFAYSVKQFVGRIRR
jgi:hypothetical protein